MLQETLTACVAEHCRLQVEAGASRCLQIFESWIGRLTDCRRNPSRRPCAG